MLWCVLSCIDWANFSSDFEIYAFLFHCSSSTWRRRAPTYRSIDYGNRFKQFCQNYFPADKVHVRSIYSPDEDFTYASMSKVFVPPPHSGYARLIGNLVKLNKGRVLSVQDFWDPKLDPDPEVASSFLMSSKSWYESVWDTVYESTFLCVTSFLLFMMSCLIVRNRLRNHGINHDGLETVPLVGNQDRISL